MALTSVLAQAAIALTSAIAFRFIYNLYFHPLSKFPGPWYTAISSLPLAIISLLKVEPQFLLYVSKKYRHGDLPIRISPSLLLFPQPSALKPIYWTHEHNTKTGLYGTGLLGPPNLFTITDGNVHRTLRKALGGNAWSFGALKRTWEPRIDELITLFISKMTDFSSRGEEVVLCDKVAQFAADVMALLCFGQPWGFIAKSRDERNILQSFRDGLVLFGFIGRWKGFRENVLHSPLGKYILPAPTDEKGVGFLVGQADKLVTEREKKIKEENFSQEKPDFMQLALEARVDGERPLSDVEKRAHVTILMMAGADTTGTALGSTLNYLLTHPRCLEKARQEIDAAQEKGLLSSPVIQYEETRQHLPYTIACIKEGGLRLRPPATNLFGRVAGPGGAQIGNVHVPEGMEMTSNAYVVQRDPELFGPDPEEFRPERWLESEEKTAKMEAGLFVFGMGPRVCLGKDIAYFELYKLIPEIIRRFDMELVREGRYVVAGGVAYNVDLTVRLGVRKVEG
ncbi:Pisatin demethylase [Naviculisporaceae sp. PSN 640]